MANLSRRKLLSSLAVAPAIGVFASRAAAQSGVYGSVAPPKKALPPGFVKTDNTPSEALLQEQARVDRQKIQALHFPDVVLVNQDGKKMRFYTDMLKDKVVVLNFFYAKCEGVCPGVTANLAKLYKLLGNRMGNPVFMYSITLKPEHDTVPVIKQYAQPYHAGPFWSFLTGTDDDIEKVRRGIGFVNSDPILDRDKSQHIGNIKYGNEPHGLWGTCPGLTHASWLFNEVSWVLA